MPAREREKLITDNRLCPFCLLHDKDKPCRAKERSVSVACAAASCKGRHIQKLHDFLKDVFREENRVHVVHGDGEWEESHEAWELGEEEMMIVGTVQQEDDCSWQEVCSTWMSHSEEVTVGVHQVGAGQEVVEQATVSQCKKAGAAGEGERTSEPEGLLLEGEEQEYFLELLMRRASPERPKAGLSTRGKAAPAKSKKSRKKEKKALGGSLSGRTADEGVKGERAASPAVSLEKQAAPDLAGHPEAKGRRVAEGSQEKKEHAARAQATSGGECS